MSEDNGQDRKDKESDDSVAKHLAEKRRALDLRTRPMEVIDDLDWDIPDFDDDDDFAAPAAAAETTPEPVEAAEPVQTDHAQRERPKRVSSGTMMMSASAFKDAMDDESPGDESAGDSGSETATTVPVVTEPVVESHAEDERKVARSAGGTMMMSTDGLAALDDSDASAERHREASREWHREEMEAADQADSADDASPGSRGAGGTMLISGKALAEEMVKQSDSTEKTPYEQMAEEAEVRHHHPAATSEHDNDPTQATASPMEHGLDNTDPERRDVPRSKGQGLLYGAVISLGIGILVLVWMLFFKG